WMVYRNAEKLGLYPMESYVKVGDTEVDMLEGRNAGVWTVGVVFGGNEPGLSLAQFEMLTEREKEKTYVEISERLTNAGAHYIIREIGELDRIIAHIDNRMKEGGRP
ncbi:MAG: phnX, partial [Paenibacillus sp.]|nr:phnX [Paenibacillus sp.]